MILQSAVFNRKFAFICVLSDQPTTGVKPHSWIAQAKHPALNLSVPPAAAPIADAALQSGFMFRSRVVYSLPITFVKRGSEAHGNNPAKHGFLQAVSSLPDWIAVGGSV